MIGAVLLAAFVAGISAQTVTQTCPPPPVIIHAETGDELYRVLLSDLNDAELAAASISAAAQGAGGCTKFENIDFFTQLLITINADNTWLDKMGGNYVPSGDECVGENLRIDFDLKNIQRNAATPIPSPDCPPTGQARSQYVLQQFGRALTALGNAPAGPVPPGCWQKYVQDLNGGIVTVQQIIANNDTANCVAATKRLANALKGIRASADPNNCPITVQTTVGPGTTTMGSSGYSG